MLKIECVKLPFKEGEQKVALKKGLATLSKHFTARMIEGGGGGAQLTI